MHLAEVLTVAQRLCQAGLPCVACLLVATRGSTPQKAGALMLLHADGNQTGTLGGGCVEAEVRRRALADWQAPPTLHTFWLDNDYGWDDGLICGGRMTVLIAPLNTSALPFLHAWHTLHTTGAGYTLGVTHADHPQPIFCGLFASDGSLPLTWPASTNWSEPAFRLAVPQQREVLIVGAGHVGQAVAELAHRVELAVRVLDDRASLLTPERFPHARERIVGDIGRTLRERVPTLAAHHAGLIVTRGHQHDEEALYHLAPSAAGYVGMIGSQRKVRLIFADLRAKGLAEAALDRVRAPVGINIGAQSVTEIAISIVAELIAWRASQRA
jgi:xanthine dehydrogenase accessory factor